MIGTRKHLVNDAVIRLMRYFLLLLFVLTYPLLHAQVDPIQSGKKIDTSKIKKKGKKNILADSTQEITIEDYKISSYARDTTTNQTTLTIQKE